MSGPVVSAKGIAEKGIRTPTRVNNKRVREPTEVNSLTGEGPVTKIANREGSEYFTGIVVLLVESGVQMGRLQVCRPYTSQRLTPVSPP